MHELAFSSLSAPRTFAQPTEQETGVWRHMVRFHSVKAEAWLEEKAGKRVRRPTLRNLSFELVPDCSLIMRVKTTGTIHTPERRALPQGTPHFHMVFVFLELPSLSAVRHKPPDSMLLLWRAPHILVRVVGIRVVIKRLEPLQARLEPRYAKVETSATARSNVRADVNIPCDLLLGLCASGRMISYDGTRWRERECCAVWLGGRDLKVWRGSSRRRRDGSAGA